MAITVRARGAAAAVLGFAVLVVIAGVLVFWIGAEITIAAVLLSTGQPFLGACMIGIAAANFILGFLALGRSVSR